MAVHDALTDASLPHAFGGAIALAYCTLEPRGTRDLDVNVFVDIKKADSVLLALPAGVESSAADLKALKQDGQRRLWWGETPVDLFVNYHPLHEQAAKQVVWVPLAGRDVPVLDGASLVVFKALFDRTKDWADIEAVAEASPKQVQAATLIVKDLLGRSDAISLRLATLV